MSKAEVTKQLLDLLVTSNRPYALNDIIAKCDKELSKSAIQKALDTLEDNEQINVKINGKTKIYYAKQRGDAKSIDNELKMCTRKLTEAKDQLRQKEHECRELESKVRNVQPVRSLESLDDERNDLYDEIRHLNELLRKQEVLIAESKLTAIEANKIEKRFDEVTKAFRKRKRICTEMLDAILEGYPKTKKALIEDIGLETDESVGFSLNQKRHA